MFSSHLVSRSHHILPLLHLLFFEVMLDFIKIRLPLGRILRFKRLVKMHNVRLQECMFQKTIISQHYASSCFLKNMYLKNIICDNLVYIVIEVK